MLRCLPLLLALVMTQSYAYTITTSYINPTYMSIQIDGLDNVGSVDISLYDWDTYAFAYVHVFVVCRVFVDI